MSKVGEAPVMFGVVCAFGAVCAFRGGADSDFLMKPVSECSEKPVLPGFFGGKSSIKTRKSGFTRIFGGKKGIWNRKSGFSGSSKTRIPLLCALSLVQLYYDILRKFT